MFCFPQVYMRRSAVELNAWYIFHGCAGLNWTSVVLVCFVLAGLYGCRYDRTSKPTLFYRSTVTIKPNPEIQPNFLKKSVSCEAEVLVRCCVGNPYKVKLTVGDETCKYK